MTDSAIPTAKSTTLAERRAPSAEVSWRTLATIETWAARQHDYMLAEALLIEAACRTIRSLCAERESIARETREATVRECIEVAKQLADYHAPGAPHGCVLEAGDVEDRLRAMLPKPDGEREET